MSEQIFRQKSLDKMKSPESLNDYIRVSNPGVWLLLIAVIALLVGTCIWGVFGHIDSTVPAEAHVENGSVTCLVDEADLARITVDMPVRIGNAEGTLSSVGTECSVFMDTPPADGVYPAQIVVERIHPISFVLN